MLDKYKIPTKKIKKNKKWHQAEALFSCCEVLIGINIENKKPYQDCQLELNNIYAESYDTGNPNDLLEASQELYDMIMDRPSIDAKFSKLSQDEVIAFTQAYNKKILEDYEH